MAKNQDVELGEKNLCDHLNDGKISLGELRRSVFCNLINMDLFLNAW